MGWNDEYWKGRQQRAQEAKKHHEQMLLKYPVQIRDSIAGTVVWDDEKARIAMQDNPVRQGAPKIIVQNADTVTGLFENQEGKTVVLNFASYKNPGGAFLGGSGAQEEALCHESTLYEILSSGSIAPYYTSNKERPNRSLYTNRALWTPGVVFCRGRKEINADVLTVAAPNRKAYMDYTRGADEAENLEALESRIRFISDLIKIHQMDTAILGAFGCGVFAQDPETVASLFKAEFADTGIKTVYAVINKGGHSKEGAYAVFKRIFS